MNEFKLLIQKSYDFILAITMPLTVGLIFISKSAILLLSGDGFCSCR
jgi:peptidoglycan biosynthesis protein MviN/MurJ (putative lipid II flippase)